jgi:hypothetical protein
MDVKDNMAKKRIEFIGETGDVKGFWGREYGMEPSEERVITYGLLRVSGVSGSKGEAVLRNWPATGTPLAVQWENDVIALRNVEIKEGGVRVAKYSPGKAIPGLGEIEILRIAGTKDDVGEYKKNINSLEHGYVPVQIPVYRREKNNFTLEGKATLYMESDFKYEELPKECSGKELVEKVKGPFAIVGNDRGSTSWFMGRKRPEEQK